MGGRGSRVEYRTDPALQKTIDALQKQVASMQTSAQQAANAKAEHMKREQQLREDKKEMKRMFDEQQRLRREEQQKAVKYADDLKRANAAAEQDRAKFARQLKEMSDKDRRREITSQLQVSRNEQAAVQEQRLVYMDNLRRLEGEFDALNRKVGKLHDQCDAEEARLRATFPEEFDAPGTKRLVLLGITGNGKSTFGNRLCGDESEDANETGPFKTSNSATSETKGIQAHGTRLRGVPLSVVDTPGTFDTEGEDRFHANQLVEYLRGCGGVDAFLVFKNGTDPRLDQSYEGMLKDLENMLGREFFAHVIIIATRVEPGRPTREFNKIKAGFRAEILRKMKLPDNGGVPMPMIGVGLDQYQDQLDEVLKAVPSKRYMCETLKGPLEVLRAQIAQEEQVVKGKQQEVDTARTTIAQLDKRAATLATNIRDLERQLQSPVSA